MDQFFDRLGTTYVVLFGGILIGVALLVFFPARRRNDSADHGDEPR